MPVIRPPSSFPAQVGPDPARAEHDWPLQLVLVLPGLRNRSPALFFIRHGAHELTVAMPAGLSDVHLASQRQRIGAFGVEPRFTLLRVGRLLAVGPFERFWIAAGQVFELVSQVAGDE